MKIAVIDLGTNTCNLLIAEIVDQEYRLLHQSKQLVRLGDDKIKDDEIGPEATHRTISALKKHLKVIADFRTNNVELIATSAVRSAINKYWFLEKIYMETGLDAQIISGENEAELIFNGVLLAFENIVHPSVILDIGGGSNELIYTNNNKLLWQESRPTGMSRIIHQFQISDPITREEVSQLKKHFSVEHNEAFVICKNKDVKTLIGCSGAFDTIADIIDKVNPGEKFRKTQEISIRDFYKVYSILIQSTRNERLKMKGMDMVRVDLIVPAVILIEQIVSELKLTQIIQTDFALREGVLFEILKKTQQD